jgi:hypothetical protein
MTAVLLLQSLMIVVFCLLFLALKNILPAYLSERGKNLATKKDIEEITRKVEVVKAEVSLGVESFKLALNKELHGFSTQFSRLDGQRATGIMEIHGLMCDIEQSLIWDSSAAATAAISSTPEARTMDALNKAWEGVAKLNRVLNYHSLLLNEQVYARIQDWSKEVQVVVAATGNEIEPLRRQAVNLEGSLSERETAIAAVRDKHLDPALARLGPIRKELEMQFRKLLAAQGT